MGARFWRVWTGETVSGIRDAAFTVAFAWLVLSGTGSAGVLAGTLAAGAVTRGGLLLVGQLVGAIAAGITWLPARWGRLIGLMGVAEAATFVAVGLSDRVVVAAVLLGLLGALGTAPVSPPRR